MNYFIEWVDKDEIEAALRFAKMTHDDLAVEITRAKRRSYYKKDLPGLQKYGRNLTQIISKLSLPPGWRRVSLPSGWNEAKTKNGKMFYYKPDETCMELYSGNEERLKDTFVPPPPGTTFRTAIGPKGIPLPPPILKKPTPPGLD